MKKDPKQVQSDLEDAARPLIQWLCENFHPHVTVIVTPTSAELVEGIASARVMDYVRD